MVRAGGEQLAGLAERDAVLLLVGDVLRTVPDDLHGPSVSHWLTPSTTTGLRRRTLACCQPGDDRQADVGERLIIKASFKEVGHFDLQAREKPFSAPAIGWPGAAALEVIQHQPSFAFWSLDDGHAYPDLSAPAIVGLQRLSRLIDHAHLPGRSNVPGFSCAGRANARAASAANRSWAASVQASTPRF